MSDDNRTVAVFLDRDGTIIEDRGVLKDPCEIFFFPDTVKALQKLQEHYLLFIVTNQSGVAEGSDSLEDVKRVNDAVVAALAEEGIEITAVFVCPHHRRDNAPASSPIPSSCIRQRKIIPLA